MHMPRPAKLLFEKIRDGRRFLFVTPVIFLGGPYWSWGECWPAGRARWGHAAIAVPHPVAAKSKGCSACGLRATEQWIAEQQHVLPACEWLHITFMMPDTLWPVFQSNRWLLNRLFSCASQTLIVWAKKLELEIGIFSALHTYERRLKWHPHIHLSVTRGGLCQQHHVWRSIFFKKKVAERYWRLAVITLLRHPYGQLDLSAPAYAHIRDYREWCQFLDSQFQRRWKVHFAKKTKHFRQTVNYLGRYLKRPPIAASRLRHYSGGTITFRYLDHRTQRHKSLVLSQEEMIWRYISHIPPRHFR